MKSKTLVALILLPLLLLPLISVLPVYASQEIPVSGTWGAVGTRYDTWHKWSGNNLFYGYSVSAAIKGDLKGNMTNFLHNIYHFGTAVTPFDPNAPGVVFPPCTTNPQFDFYVTGSVFGHSGTFIMHLTGTGHAGPTFTHTEGTWVITGGTGGLANLHGEGTMTLDKSGSNPFVNTYTGQVHFDP